MKPFPVRCLALTAVLLLWLPASAAAQNFKIATIAPEGSEWMKDMRAGADAIEKSTGGRVTFKFYGGGVQGNDKQVQRKMRTGQLHGAAFTSGGMGLFQHDADILSLPLLFNDIAEARFIRDHVESDLRQRLEDAGYANFGFAAAGFAYMMSTRPIRTSADMNGQKVWVPEGDRASFDALQALGVAPVVMPVTDVLTGLQTDLLDCVAAPPVGAIVLQWHTRLRYITDMPLAYVYAGLLIDGRAFGRMGAEDQAVVREVMEGIYRKFDRHGVADNDEAMEALLDSGLKRVHPEPEQVAEWRKSTDRTFDTLAAEGELDADMLGRIRSLLQSYRQDKGGSSGR